MKIVRRLILDKGIDLVNIFGPYDQHLKMVRDEFEVNVSIKDNVVKVIGSKRRVEPAMKVLERLSKMAKEVSGVIEQEDVVQLIKDFSNPRSSEGVPKRHLSNVYSLQGSTGLTGEINVQPRTEGQRGYLEILSRNDIVFSIGPAGTGKTYLAVAHALAALRKGTVKKIVLCRPAVEAGEKLGFLPGDYQAKVNPYLRPLYDALNSFLEFQQLRRLMETEIIEVVPLAYMRGRNLDNAFMILDEGQNTTSDQMKMFLTRMGTRSKIVVTGDITQIDLPVGKISGLIAVQSILNNIPGIGFSYLTRVDIVRHPLVQSIVNAYEIKTPASSRTRKHK